VIEIMAATALGTDQRAPRARSKVTPARRHRRDYPTFLEELQALQDALEASEERRAGLETILDDLLEEVPQGAVERLPEDLLRRIFARLPQPVQDALHARLFSS
jgi:hypothetical protein